MPINNISSDLGFEGITIGGVPFGGTRLAGGSVSGGAGVGIEDIVLIARQVTRSATISSGGNPFIPLPVTFGKNKFVMAVDGKLYCPGTDFIITSSGASWINSNVSIPTNVDVVVWGPANEYTANLVTIESVNMNGAKFNALAQTIQLDGVGGTVVDGKDSLYLVVDNDLAAPADYEVDGNGLISWQGTALSTLNNVFAFYFNKASSVPYRLPIAQTRILIQPTAGQTEFTLTAVPRAVNAGAAHMIVDAFRQVYGKHFSIEYPKLKWFGSAFSGSEQLDISYIRDVSSLPGAFTDSTSTASISVGPGGQYVIPTSNTPIKAELGLFTINGDLVISETYSHITMNGVNVFSPEVVRSGNTLVYNPTARLPRYDIALDDELVYSGFTDAGSANGLKIEYFQGFTGSSQNYTLQSTPADASKVVMWVNGRAYFPLGGDVAVVGAQVGPTAQMNYIPADPLADVVILYISDPSLAAQWNITALSIATATWAPGASIGTLTKPITDKNSSFLFTNGQREDPSKYGLSNSGYSLQNTSLAGTVYQSDQVVLLWI